MTTFTWLHLTDMHVGQEDFGYDLALAIGNVVDDLKKLVGKVGADLRPDTILFTGDLAYSGKQYGSPGGGPATRDPPSVESTLTDLLRLWPWPERPKLVPVPGNHDLVWQTFELDQLVLWDTFDDDERGRVRGQFFDVRLPKYWLKRKVAEGFSGYTRWLGETGLPMIRIPAVRPGRLPGEYAATFETADGVRIGLLALNTAYRDIVKLDGKRPPRLRLDPEQLQALGFAEWRRDHHVCLALTHHPPAWMDEHANADAREDSHEPSWQYFQPDQITLHLCGHLHDLNTAQYGGGFGDRTLLFQGRSLFGVERDKSGKVGLSLGYAIGQLRFTEGADQAVLRVFPRHAVLKDGTFRFQGDGPVNIEHHLDDKHVKIRPWNRTGAVVPQPTWPEAEPHPGGPSPVALLEPVVDRVWRTLTLNGPRQSVFLSGPPRYGKTTVVEVVRNRLAATVRVVPRDLNLIESRQRGIPRAVIDFLIEGIAPVFGQRGVAYPDLAACLGACLSDPRSRCVLIIEKYHLIKAGAQRGVAHQLRSCMEQYRPRFRLVLVSRQPLAQVAPITHTHEASSIATMLTEIDLSRIGVAEFIAWATTLEPFRNRQVLVEWMHRHTGGHPWLLSKLLQRLFEVPNSTWPAWTDDRASDDDRARGVHDADGPLGEVVRQLHDELIAFAPNLKAARDHSLGLQTARGELIPFVTARLEGGR